MTSEPDHTVVELSSADRFIVLASDGVWEFISSKEAVDIIAHCESAEEGCRQVSMSGRRGKGGAWGLGVGQVGAWGGGEGRWLGTWSAGGWRGQADGSLRAVGWHGGP